MDGKAYYTFEFVAQAPNFTRHALSTIVIANGIYKYLHIFSPSVIVTVIVTVCLFFFGREVLHFDNGGKREKMGEDERQIKHRC